MARSQVPDEIVERIHAVLGALAECEREAAWTGVRWRVGKGTVAHVFGGEDQRTRLTFRADAGEVMALGHIGEPYFAVGWSNEVGGLVIDADTDWSEVRELLTDAYCIQAPQRLSSLVERPEPQPD